MRASWKSTASIYRNRPSLCAGFIGRRLPAGCILQGMAKQTAVPKKLKKFEKKYPEVWAAFVALGAACH